MAQTNQTLVDFVQNLPLSDKVSALKSLIVYDTQNGSFDDLLMSINSSLDFTKISPLRLILEMGRLNDRTQNVQRFVNDSCSYLPVIIQVPDLFNPNYNSDLLFSEFVMYIKTHSSDMPYIQNVIRCSIQKEPSSTDFFLRVLNQFAYRFHQSRLAESLSDLQIFYSLLAVDEIRYTFCQANYFFQIMSFLFMKSVFPIGQGLPDFLEYFGDSDEPNHAKLSKLEEVLSSYYSQLKNIMLLCCRTNTQAKTFEFIRNFFLDMKHRANDQSYWMARYNFECTLMEISFLKQNDWPNSNPFTPYMKETLAPIGSEYELSVVGKYSWVDPNNLTLDAMKLTYGDRDEDIINDQQLWQQKLQEVSNQKPNPQSNFFFATLQAIDLSSVNFLNIIDNIARNLHFKPNNPHKKELRKLSFAIQVLLCLNFKSSKTLDFLRGTLRFLQKTARYDHQTKSLPSKPSIEYQHLPEYILSLCVKLVGFYNQVGLIPAANDKLFEFIQMESSLFMNKKYVRNPMIAKEIVRFFANIASQPMGRGNCHLIVTDTVIEEVYPAVVDFFSRVEKTGTSSEYYDKMNIRRPCLLLMAFWMKHRECRNYFISHYKDNENTNFLFHLVSDLSFYIQNCFSSIAQLNGTFSENSPQITIENDQLAIRDELKSDFSTVKDYYNLVNEIASFAPYAFDDDKTAYILSTTVINIFRKAIEPGKLIVPNPDEIEYDQNYFLISATSLISLMANNENVLNKFFDSSLGFNDQLSNQTLALLQSLSQRSRDYESIYHRFQTFIGAIKSLNILILPPDVEIPEGLYDPLTDELLVDPVKMPSGYVYNRSTIEKLTDLIDPYAQTPFLPDDPVPDLETKRKAEQFFKEHAVPSKK